MFVCVAHFFLCLIMYKHKFYLLGYSIKYWYLFVCLFVVVVVFQLIVGKKIRCLIQPFFVITNNEVIHMLLFRWT